MRGERKLLPLMGAAERDDYAAWLVRIAKGRKGPLPDRLRQAAKEIKKENFYEAHLRRLPAVLRVKKTGHHFIEAMPTEVPACGTADRHTAVPGKTEAAFWQPYKLWCGDLWECPGCGAQTISGVGREPVAEHYQPDFDATVERIKEHQEMVQVNDC